jgi:hypothetical protein
MRSLTILRDTLLILAIFFAVLVGFYVAAADAIPQHYGVTMP